MKGPPDLEGEPFPPLGREGDRCQPVQAEGAQPHRDRNETRCSGHHHGAQRLSVLAVHQQKQPVGSSHDERESAQQKSTQGRASSAFQRFQVTGLGRAAAVNVARAWTDGAPADPFCPVRASGLIMGPSGAIETERRTMLGDVMGGAGTEPTPGCWTLRQWRSEDAVSSE